MSALASPPSGDTLVETDITKPARRDPFYISKSWFVWLTQSLIPRIVQSVAVLLGPATQGGRLTNQNQSLGVSSLATGKLAAGTYRVTYYARKTFADGVASSLTVTLGWTENGLALSLSGAPMVADTVSSPQNGSITVTIDGNSALTYSTAYASTTPNRMRYKVEFTVEALQA